MAARKSSGGADGGGSGKRFESDMTKTTAHLMDSVKFNRAHAMHHAQEAERQLGKLKQATKKAPIANKAVQAEAKKIAQTKQKVGLKGMPGKPRGA